MNCEIAEDLGIGLSTLVRWIGRSRDRQIDHPPEGAREEMAAELKRLRRENEILRQERDILKKSAAMLGTIAAVPRRSSCVDGSRGAREK